MDEVHHRQPRANAAGCAYDAASTERDHFAANAKRPVQRRTGL